jgi:hypothetical protein
MDKNHHQCRFLRRFQIFGFFQKNYLFFIFYFLYFFFYFFTIPENKIYPQNCPKWNIQLVLWDKNHTIILSSHLYSAFRRL